MFSIWIDAFNFTLGMAMELLKSPFWLPLLLLFALTIWCIIFEGGGDTEGMGMIMVFLMLIIPIFLFFSCFFIMATKGTILLPLVFWLAITNDR